MSKENNKSNLCEYPYEYLSKDEIKNQRVEKLLSKLENLEQKVLSYFNLTGKEICINLRNSNFNDTKLELLSGVEFKNSEELNLSHNIIINILPLKNFKTLKNLNLSFNKIKDLKPLKEISKNNKEIKEINLRNNEIEDIEILKHDIFPCISKIYLENNKNLIQKDIDEIINIIKVKKNIDKDNKNNFRNYYEILEEIRRKEFEIIYKAKEKKSGELRAIKLLEKPKIMESLIKYYNSQKKEDITEPNIEGWHDEINNMKILDNSNEYLVKIYDYFDTNEELAIIMELCDENLDELLRRRKNGFKPKELKKIFSKLNNVFKISYKKIYQTLYNNILIKYLDINKTRYCVKFKFSDSIRTIDPKTFIPTFYTSTHFISCGFFEKNNVYCQHKRDILSSLGAIIYKLIFKEEPYKNNNNNSKNINLRETNDENLDDLLYQLLKKDDFSWEEYFIHPFFQN